MNLSHHSLAILTAVIVFAGCKKDDPASPISTPTTPTTNVLRALFNDHVDDATQTFTIDAALDTWVNGSSGTMIYFVPNAFRTAGGAMVTGNVEVELIEVLDVATMIWLNKQTLGNDNGQLRPLVSGGQYYLNATQAGQQLRLADNAGTVYMPAPDGADPNMQLFTGSVDSDGTITWDPASALPPQVDSMNYVFGNDTLGWVNCDYFMGVGTQTDVQVTCPTGYDEDNTLMWIVVPDLNAITSFYAFSGNVFGTIGYYTLPVGLNVKIVALSNAGGTYSSSFITTTITDGMDLPITFSPTTLAEFEAELSTL